MCQQVAAASALLQQVAASSIPLSCVVDDMTAQVTDLIAMTLQVHKSLPKDSRNQLTVDQYTMPANFRRRLKSLRHAPPICYSLPLDPAGNYWDGVSGWVAAGSPCGVRVGWGSSERAASWGCYSPRGRRTVCELFYKHP